MKKLNEKPREMCAASSTWLYIWSISIELPSFFSIMTSILAGLICLAHPTKTTGSQNLFVIDSVVKALNRAVS